MITSHKKASLIFLLVIIPLTILSLAQIASAASIEKIEITNILDDDLSISEVMDIEIINNSQDEISFMLPEQAYDISVNDNPQSQTNNHLNIGLDCDVCQLKIKYRLNNAIKKISSDAFTFSRTVNLPQKPKELHYSIQIPPGYIIGPQDYQNEPSIVPLAKEIKTDGKSIIIAWHENNPELPKRYYLKYHSHENLESPFEEFMNELSEWPVWIMILLSMIFGSIIGILIYIRLNSNNVESEHIPSSLLNPDEKIILKLLKENDNKMNQKDIGKQLDWSKSKVSSIMTNLQYKEIIKREKLGRNYKVQVIKKIQGL